MIGAPHTLLVVDDDLDFGDSLGDMLEISGYEVTLARSGDEAIRRCRERDFDLVLMDVRMPGTDGIDAYLAMRAREPDVRVILMTTDPGTELLDRALSAGARAVVAKPPAPARLVELIETHRHR